MLFLVGFNCIWRNYKIGQLKLNCKLYWVFFFAFDISWWDIWMDVFYCPLVCCGTINRCLFMFFHKARKLAHNFVFCFEKFFSPQYANRIDTHYINRFKLIWLDQTKLHSVNLTTQSESRLNLSQLDSSTMSIYVPISYVH